MRLGSEYHDRPGARRRDIPQKFWGDAENDTWNYLVELNSPGYSTIITEPGRHLQLTRQMIHLIANTDNRLQERIGIHMVLIRGYKHWSPPYHTGIAFQARFVRIDQKYEQALRDIQTQLGQIDKSQGRPLTKALEHKKLLLQRAWIIRFHSDNITDPAMIVQAEAIMQQAFEKVDEHWKAKEMLLDYPYRGHG